MELQNTAQSTGNGGCVESLKSKKVVLADLLDSRAQGGASQLTFLVSLMDSPSKFFFSLEKKKGQSRQIHALRAEDGQQLTGIADIRNRAVDFYVKLYSSEYQEDDADLTRSVRTCPQSQRKPTGSWRGP